MGVWEETVLMGSSEALEPLDTDLVTGNAFQFLGVTPLVGPLAATRRDLNEPLKASSRGSTGRSRMRFMLVVGEVALSFFLLTGAGLLMRSFFRQQAILVAHGLKILGGVGGGFVAGRRRAPAAGTE